MDDDALRRMVRDRPIPERLIRKLHAAPLIDEADIGRVRLRMRTNIPLTAREVTVLRSLGDGGLTIGETAELWGCSLEAVKSDLKSAKAKLSAKTTLQAVVRAVRQELI